MTGQLLVICSTHMAFLDRGKKRKIFRHTSHLLRIVLIFVKKSMVLFHPLQNYLVLYANIYHKIHIKYIKFVFIMRQNFRNWFTSKCIASRYVLCFLEISSLHYCRKAPTSPQSLTNLYFMSQYFNIIFPLLS